MISRAFLLVLLTLAGLAHAQQYRWVDKNGRVQYTDTPPPASAKDVRKTDSARRRGRRSRRPAAVRTRPAAAGFSGHALHRARLQGRLRPRARAAQQARHPVQGSSVCENDTQRRTEARLRRHRRADDASSAATVRTRLRAGRLRRAARQRRLSEGGDLPGALAESARRAGRQACRPGGKAWRHPRRRPGPTTRAACRARRRNPVLTASPAIPSSPAAAR